MKKLICLIIIAMSLTLVSCQEQEFTYNATIEDFKDCKFAKIVSNHGDIKAIRCPNSTTTTSQQIGKVIVPVVVADNSVPAAPTMTCKKIDGDIYKCKL